MEARSDSYEDLGERALPSALVVVTRKLAGTLLRAAVNIHCEIAYGVTTNPQNSNYVHKKIPLKRRRAGPVGPASMKKKKLIANLCKKAFALFVY